MKKIISAFSLVLILFNFSFAQNFTHADTLRGSNGPGRSWWNATKYDLHVTGSTRMKSGTAQKMVLNMISTTAMIQMGRVEDNKMVNMKLTNQKIVKRGTRMLMERTGIKDEKTAEAILLKYDSVKKAIENYK